MRVRGLFRILAWNVAVLIVCLLGTGCDDGKENGTTTTTTTPPEDTTTTTTPECSYRPDPTPPAYDWTIQREIVGQATVRYFAPSAPVGLVMLFDGGAGSSVWFEQMESRLLVEALVGAGYAVMALESDDWPADGNFDVTDAATNADIVNLQAAIALARTGIVPVSAPLFYLGFSSGGRFASLATRYVPANAMALLNVRGDTITFDDPSDTNPFPPPTLWVIGRNDPRVMPDDGVLQVNLMNIEAAGQEHEMFINEPIGARDEAFARIADPSYAVSVADSTQAVAALMAAGYLDGCRVPTDRSANLDLSVISLGASFTPPVGDPADRFIKEALRQIDELYGAHEVTSDFKENIVAWFNAFR